MSAALSTLEGAAVINNTLCLGVFLSLVYLQHLSWEFSAETISIVGVELAICLSVCCRRGHRLLDGFLIVSLYPLSISAVWVLERMCSID